MAHQEREQWPVAKRAAWIGGAIIVLLVIAVLTWALLPRRHPRPTPEPLQSAQLHTIVPTATAASTPMPKPTSTSTSSSSHTPELTPTATEKPTSTLSPSTATSLPSSTSSRTATSSPTSTPSRTAIPHTPTPSPTPRPPSPTPSPTAAYACPMLIEPQEGSSHTGAVTFRWQSAGTLQPGDLYDVRAWQGDEELGIGRTTETEFTVSDPALVRGPGLYRWRVAVIRIVGSDPNKDWQIVSPLPEARTFSWGQPPQPTPTEEGG